MLLVRFSLLLAALVCAIQVLASPLPGNCCRSGGVLHDDLSDHGSQHSSSPAHSEYIPPSDHSGASPLFSHNRGRDSMSSQVTRTGSGSWSHGSHTDSPYTQQTEHAQGHILPHYVITDPPSPRTGTGARIRRVNPDTGSFHSSLGNSPATHGRYGGHDGAGPSNPGGAGPSTSGARYSRSASSSGYSSPASGRSRSASPRAGRGGGIHIRG